MDKRKNALRDKQLTELRATAAQLREMLLAAVLERLGGIPDPSNKHNWKTPVGRISVDGSKFFNHELGAGGGGAIDLVKAVTETDYKGAATVAGLWNETVNCPLCPSGQQVDRWTLLE